MYLIYNHLSCRYYQVEQNQLHPQKLQVKDASNILLFRIRLWQSHMQCILISATKAASIEYAAETNNLIILLISVIHNTLFYHSFKSSLAYATDLKIINVLGH